MRIEPSLLLLVLLSTSAVQGQPRDRFLVVLELGNRLTGSDKDALDLRYFSDSVRGLAGSMNEGIRIITRENLVLLVEASGKTLAECEAECEVETGRRVGADLVVSGELYRLGSSYRLNLRLHDTRSAALLSGAQAEGTSVAELDKNLLRACEDLFAPLRGAASPPAGPVYSFTSNDPLQLQVQLDDKLFGCPQELSPQSPCEIVGLHAGPARLILVADEVRSLDVQLGSPSDRYVLSRRSSAPFAMGLLSMGLGGLAIGLGVSAQNAANERRGVGLPAQSFPEDRSALLPIGILVASVGAVLVLVDLVQDRYSYEVRSRRH